VSAPAWVWLGLAAIGATAALYGVVLALREDGKLPKWAANRVDRLP
jgi:hypothetical protein